MQFKDYPAEQIAEKLAQVEDFEKNYGVNNRTKSWRKWCTDYEYRKREWQFRQSVANYASKNAHKTLQTKQYNFQII